MSKKRQTKKQKIAASTRQNFSQVLSAPSISLDLKLTPIQREIPIQNTPTQDYSYVIADVRKTLLITSLLIILDLVIYFLLKQKIISFFGLTF
ncbi:MAG TPA: hypothetical protein VHE53_03860 [Patescibacteria group bacterium]|nr:hypothetical protein [Patescibacteria group bacterium]